MQDVKIGRLRSINHRDSDYSPNQGTKGIIKQIIHIKHTPVPDQLGELYRQTDQQSHEPGFRPSVFFEKQPDQQPHRDKADDIQNKVSVTLWTWFKKVLEQIKSNGTLV